MEDIRPKVGVGVAVRKDGKILLWKRKNAHGEWSRSFPWGHLEYNEEIEECARREVMEETWITIKNIHIRWFTNDIFYEEHKHYITLYVVCDYDEWEVELVEPEKCEQWEWFEWEHLPSPLFLPFQNLKKQNFHPYA